MIDFWDRKDVTPVVNQCASTLGCMTPCGLTSLLAGAASTTVPLQGLVDAVGQLGGVEGQAAVVAAAGELFLLQDMHYLPNFSMLIQSFHCRSLQEKKAQDRRVSLQTCHVLGCYLHSSPPELPRDFSREVSSHFQHHSTCVSMEFCQPFGCISSWMIKVVRQCAHYFWCFMVFLHRYFEVGQNKVGWNASFSLLSAGAHPFGFDPDIVAWHQRLESLCGGSLQCIEKWRYRQSCISFVGAMPQGWQCSQRRGQSSCHPRPGGVSCLLQDGEKLLVALQLPSFPWSHTDLRPRLRSSTLRWMRQQSWKDLISVWMAQRALIQVWQAGPGGDDLWSGWQIRCWAGGNSRLVQSKQSLPWGDLLALASAAFSAGFTDREVAMFKLKWQELVGRMPINLRCEASSNLRKIAEALSTLPRESVRSLVWQMFC